MSHTTTRAHFVRTSVNVEVPNKTAHQPTVIDHLLVIKISHHKRYIRTIPNNVGDSRQYLSDFLRLTQNVKVITCSIQLMRQSIRPEKTTHYESNVLLTNNIVNFIQTYESNVLLTNNIKGVRE